MSDIPSTEVDDPECRLPTTTASAGVSTTTTNHQKKPKKVHGVVCLDDDYVAEQHQRTRRRGHAVQRTDCRPGMGDKMPPPIYGLAWSSEGAEPQLLAMTRDNEIAVFVVEPHNAVEKPPTRNSTSTTTTEETHRTAGFERPFAETNQATCCSERPLVVLQSRPEPLELEKDHFYACAFYHTTDRQQGNDLQMPSLVAGGAKGVLFTFCIADVVSSSSSSTTRTKSDTQGVGTLVGSFQRKLTLPNSHNSSNAAGGIHEIKVSPTRCWLVVAAHEDSVCRMWDMNHHCLMAAFVGIHALLHVGLSSLDFHYSGNRLVTASEDEIVCIWECGTIVDDYLSLLRTTTTTSTCTLGNALPVAWPKTEPCPLFCTSLSRHCTEGIDCIQFYNDLLLTSSMEYICLWQAKIQPTTLLSAQVQVISPSNECVEILYEFRLDRVVFSYTKFNCSHVMLAAGNATGQVYLWDLDKMLQTDRDDDAVMDDSTSTLGDDSSLSSSSSSNNSTGKTTTKKSATSRSRILCTGRKTTVRNVRFSPNGRQLVATMDDGNLFRWEI